MFERQPGPMPRRHRRDLRHGPGNLPFPFRAMFGRTLGTRRPLRRGEIRPLILAALADVHHYRARAAVENPAAITGVEPRAFGPLDHHRIARAAHGITALVGAPHLDADLYNACFVLADGEVRCIYRKRHLPNYGVFDEERYFASGHDLVLLRLGEVKQAVDKLELAVELEPQDPTINDHLGDAYWLAGRFVEARFQWRRALALKPDPESVPKIEAKLKTGLAVSRIEEPGT